ncbi:MAG: nucleoside hydrolase [Gammaproteobacteria bacterium]
MSEIDYIVDTDIGGDFDDTLALFVALCSKSKPLAITTTHIGAKEEKAPIAKLNVSELGHPDIPVYAGIGCSRTDSKEKFMEQNPLFPAEFGFPNPGKDDTTWYPKQAVAYRESYGADFENMKIEKESAAELIVKLAKKYSPDKKLTIIALGPLHNIAEALRIDPTIAENIKLVSMGGAYPKGYNWLISPETTAAVIAKVETTVITSDFILKNGFIITPDERDAIIKDIQSKFGKAAAEDWKSWHKGDYFKKSNTHLYDPVTLYLALHPEEILSYDCMKVTFPCLDETGKLRKSEFAASGYRKSGLDDKIISLKESKESHIRFISQVKLPSLIKNNIISNIRQCLTRKPAPRIESSKFTFGKKTALVGAAILGATFFARRYFSSDKTPVSEFKPNPPQPRQ